MTDTRLLQGPIGYPRFKAWNPTTKDFLVGGFLYTMQVGGTWPADPKVTYSDFDRTTLNANPIELNAAGEPDPGVEIYLDGPTKLRLTDKDGNVIWDVDNVCVFDNMANYLTGLGFASIPDIQISGYSYGVSTVGVDAYVVTLTPAPGTLTSGLEVTLAADVANTGAASIKVNTLAVTAIKQMTPAGIIDLYSNQIIQNGVYKLIYNANAAAFILLNPTQIEPYQVGDIHISINPANPATYFYYGTWVAFATGQTIFGVDTGQTEFDTVEKTGGAKVKDISHIHTFGKTLGLGDAGLDYGVSAGAPGIPKDAGAAPFTNTDVGGSVSQDVLNPYITVYMWKRTV